MSLCHARFWICRFHESVLSDSCGIKQAKVLMVTQVLKWHSMLEDPELNHVDKALVGYILVTFCSGCRHSDLSHVDSVLCDFDCNGGYIEISILFHKTSRMTSQTSRSSKLVYLWVAKWMVHS